MLKKICLLAALVIRLLSNMAFAQDYFTSAYSNALCGAISCAEGFVSVGYNPAGTALSDLCAGVNYSSKFGLKELSHKSARLAVPVGQGTISSGFNYYGFQLFNRTSSSLCYATRLGKFIYSGVSLRYHTLHIDDNVENQRSVGADIGLLASLGSWRFGSWISNITNSQFNANDTIIPISLRIGTCYIINGQHSIIMDFDKRSTSDEIAISVGATAKIKDLKFVVGFSNQPFSIGAGIVYCIKNTELMFTAQHTEYLGWSPSASINYIFKKNENRERPAR